MDPLWFFKVSGTKLSAPPPKLVESLKRGGFYKAAAWETTPEGFNLFLLTRVKSQDFKDVRAAFQRKCHSSGPIGKYLPNLNTDNFECKPSDVQSFLFGMGYIHNKIWLREPEMSVASAVALPPAPAPTAQDSQRYLSMLALEPGASVEDIKKQYKLLALQCHPDKVGPEGTAMFVKLRHAFDQLYLGKDISSDPVDAILIPKALTTQSSSLDLRNSEIINLTRHRAQLQSELLKTESRLRELSAWTSQDKKADRRQQAIAFVEQFACSAQCWDKVQLHKWFKSTGSEDLRSGNEDLDPFVQFLSWSPRTDQFGDNIGMMAKTMHVVVARDPQDLPFGIHISLPLIVWWKSQTHREKLNILGFTWKEADYRYVPGDRPPRGNLDLDVRSKISSPWVPSCSSSPSMPLAVSRPQIPGLDFGRTRKRNIDQFLAEHKCDD